MRPWLTLTLQRAANSLIHLLKSKKNELLRAGNSSKLLGGTPIVVRLVPNMMMDKICNELRNTHLCKDVAFQNGIHWTTALFLRRFCQCSTLISLHSLELLTNYSFELFKGDLQRFQMLIGLYLYSWSCRLKHFGQCFIVLGITEPNRPSCNFDIPKNGLYPASTQNGAANMNPRFGVLIFSFQKLTAYLKQGGYDTKLKLDVIFTDPPYKICREL